MKCDFCYDEIKGFLPWTFVTTGKVNLPYDPEHNVAAWRDPDGFWAACDACADLVEARDFQGLVEYGFKNPLIDKRTGEVFSLGEARWWRERLFMEFFEQIVPGSRIRGLPIWAAETQVVAKLLASEA